MTRFWVVLSTELRSSQAAEQWLLQIAARPSGVRSKPRTSVLGHSQPSLAGLFLVLIFTQDYRPGLLSAVPSGLVPIHLESYLFSAISFLNG